MQVAVVVSAGAAPPAMQASAKDEPGLDHGVVLGHFVGSSAPVVQ